MARRTIAGVEFAETGDLAALEAFGHADLDSMTEIGWPWTVHSHAYLARAAFPAGDWDRALARAETAVATEPAGAQLGQCLAAQFEILAHAGKREAALALLEARTDRMPRSGQANTWGPWAFLLGVVEGLHVLGEHERAGTGYGLVVECLEQGPGGEERDLASDRVTVAGVEEPAALTFALMLDVEVCAGAVGDPAEEPFEGLAGEAGDDEQVDVFGKPLNDPVRLRQAGAALEHDLVDTLSSRTRAVVCTP